MVPDRTIKKAAVRNSNDRMMIGGVWKSFSRIDSVAERFEAAEDAV